MAGNAGSRQRGPAGTNPGANNPHALPSLCMSMDVSFARISCAATRKGLQNHLLNSFLQSRCFFGQPDLPQLITPPFPQQVPCFTGAAEAVLSLSALTACDLQKKSHFFLAGVAVILGRKISEELQQYAARHNANKMPYILSLMKPVGGGGQVSLPAAAQTQGPATSPCDCRRQRERPTTGTQAL